MFSFTSIGGKIDTSMNNGSTPPQFILNGQNYHRFGSLLPHMFYAFIKSLPNCLLT